MIEEKNSFSLTTNIAPRSVLQLSSHFNREGVTVMGRLIGQLLLVTGFTLLTAQPPVGGQQPPDAKQERTDLYGDPLPEGAVARMGAVRLRHPGGVLGLTFAPDGKTIASAGADGTARIWDVKTGKEVGQFFRGQGFLRNVAFSADGQYLDAGPDQTGRRCLVEVASGKEIRRFGFGPQTRLAEFAPSPDGKLIASLLRHDRREEKPTLLVWKADSDVPLHRLEGFQKWIRNIAFSPDSRSVAGIEDEGKVHIWEAASGRPLFQFQTEHKKGAKGFAFAADGKNLISVTWDGKFTVWEVATGKKVRQWEGRTGEVVSVGFSQQGHTLLTGGANGTASLWDPNTGREVRRLTVGHGGYVYVAVSSDGKLLAAGGGYGGFNRIRVLDAVSGEERLRFGGHNDYTASVAISPDGKGLATANRDGTVRFWDFATGKELACLDGPPYPVAQMAFTPDGKLLTLTDNGGTVVLYDVPGRKVLKRLNCTRGSGIGRMILSPDGKTFATAGTAMYLWELSTGKQLRCLGAPDVQGYYPLDFFADDKLLVVGLPKSIPNETASVQLWEAVAGEYLGALPGIKEGLVGCLALSPDGRVLATASPSDQMIGLWELATQEIRCEIPGETDGGIWRAAFSRDGRLLALSGRKLPFRLWDAYTGEELWRASQQHGEVSALAFSPDDGFLVSAGGDPAPIVWRIRDLIGGEGSHPAPLSAKELDTCWDNLGAPAARAFRAMRELSVPPRQAVPLIKDRLRAVSLSSADERRIRQYLADLDGENFAVRQKAATELGKFKELAEPALRRTLATPKSAEVRRAVTSLLPDLKGPIRSPTTLQGIRAVEVLERIGTKDAREILEGLAAKGAPGAYETREAKEALNRLKGADRKRAESGGSP